MSMAEVQSFISSWIFQFSHHALSDFDLLHITGFPGGLVLQVQALHERVRPRCHGPTSLIADKTVKSTGTSRVRFIYQTNRTTQGKWNFKMSQRLLCTTTSVNGWSCSWGGGGKCMLFHYSISISFYYHHI